MALKYKKKEEILGIDNPINKQSVSIAQTGTIPSSREEILNMSIGEVISSGRSPREIVEKVEKWCPMLNAQTILGHKNISKIKSKNYFKKVYDILSVKKLQRFTIKDLIKELGAEDLTLGDAQRKVLASMVCLGIVKKVREKYKDGNIKVKDFYYWSEEIKPCIHLKEDCCSLNWGDAEETKFYTDKLILKEKK